MSLSEPDISTNWAAVVTLYLCGCTTALHVGKLPAALPLLADEFTMSLAQTGNLVAIYAVLIALCGFPIGVVVARIGYAPFAIIGVGLCMLGSFAGVYSLSVPALMLTRLFEGLGWIMAVVVIPVIMSHLSAPKDRPVVLGLWGSFMAVGTATMLLLAPVLQASGGWRLPWIVSGVLSLIGTIAIVFVCWREKQTLATLRNPQFSANFADLRTRKTLAVALCFMCYSFQYVALTSYFPTLLVQESGMLLSSASYWVALIVFANGLGNFCAGWIINLGFKRSHILLCASLLTGILALLVFSVQDGSWSIVFAVLMTCISGIIPGTLFSTAGLVASSAAGTGIIIGFMLSGTGLGQTLGPFALARIVEFTGHWYTGGILCMVVAIAGAYFAKWLDELPAVKR